MLDKAQLKEKYQQLLKQISRLDSSYDTVDYEEIPALEKQINRVTMELEDVERQLDTLM